MVKEVQAYEAEDGTVFSERRGAQEHDAFKILLRTKVFNHGSAQAAINNAAAIVAALTPLIEEQS